MMAFTGCLHFMQHKRGLEFYWNHSAVFASMRKGLREARVYLCAFGQRASNLWLGRKRDSAHRRTQQRFSLTESWKHAAGGTCGCGTGTTVIIPGFLIKCFKRWSKMLCCNKIQNVVRESDQGFFSVQKATGKDRSGISIMGFGHRMVKHFKLQNCCHNGKEIQGPVPRTISMQSMKV